MRHGELAAGIHCGQRDRNSVTHGGLPVVMVPHQGCQNLLSKGTLLLSSLKTEVWGNKTNSFHREESHSSNFRKSLSCQELSQSTHVFTFGVQPGSSSIWTSLLLRPHCRHFGSEGSLPISNYPNDHAQLLDPFVSECGFTEVCKVCKVWQFMRTLTCREELL